jgi:chitinase
MVSPMLTMDPFLGFCGTTDAFCGDDKVKRPSCSKDTKIEKVIGYYESWSMTDRSCNTMAPDQIPYGIYTHLKYVQNVSP